MTATSADTVRFEAPSVLDFATDVMAWTGMRPEDARLVASTLVDADLRGVMSHGLVRLSIYADNVKSGRVSGTAEPSVAREDASVAVVDGQNAMGQVVATRAMDLAIERAERSGVGVVAARHSNHLGACATYARMAASRGMIGIAMTNAAAAMAPWGGVDPVVGNNPLAIAAPSGGHCPVVLDMAQTVVARGKVKLAELRGQPIPLGWAQDERGLPTQDATEGLRGALLPVGGHKGYGMAVMVDLLAGALSGAALSPELSNMGFTGAGHTGMVGPEPPGTGVGHWFLALDIQRFVPLEEFTRRVTGYAQMLRATRLAEGTARIYLPGEPECLLEQERQTSGIPYEAPVVEDLRQLASQSGLHLPTAL